MSKRNGKHGNGNGRVRRTAKAIRSGVRRYPRTILASVFDSCTPAGSTPTEMVTRLGEHALAVSWIGHGSVLCRMGSVNMVVDPVLSERIGPRFGRRTLGPARLIPAPVSPQCLRGIDLVLITHAHFDHLDRPTLRQLAAKRTQVVTPPGVRSLIPPGYGPTTTIAGGSAAKVAGVHVEAIEPRHWGARAVVDRHRRVNSYVVEADGYRVLFAGDTAETDVFAGLKGIDVAVFGVGAYEPWDHMHATPEQVWAMFRAMDAKYLLPVHHSTFELSDEPPAEPLARLFVAAGDGGDRILDARPGEIFAINTRLDDGSEFQPDRPQQGKDGFTQSIG
jgi:L-ascorbate metabolism protein UlaG (beta-lactamase superfamily)